MKALNPINFPLWGSRLIEASAGTGKTWTIAALYVRLILGHTDTQDELAASASGPRLAALMPGEILVMTFTRAATRELSNRIRQRLMEAARCFRKEQAPGKSDIFMHQLLQAYPDGQARLQAAWRLSAAAEAMDDAAIHTLDAWCQRMLREHAFDSGSLFDEELVADEHALLVQATHDYWRQQVYPLDDASLKQVFATWITVEKLVEDVTGLMPVLPAEATEAISLQACITKAERQYPQAVQALAQGWVQRAQEMMDWLEGQLTDHKALWDGRKLKFKTCQSWLEQVMQWARNPHEQALDLKALKTARARLSPQGLAASRKDPAQDFEVPENFSLFPEMVADYERLPTVAQALRWHAVAHVAKRVGHLKRQGGTFGFSDLLQRLHQALAGPQGEVLRARILAQFPVALVDEFQDTSPVQYQVLDQLYRVQANDPSSALLLIGDPKQSIYAFRGADIASYLAARKATEGRHYVLDTNFRSSQALVQAVNHWFSHAEQNYPLKAFRYAHWERGALHNPLPFQAVQAKGRDEAFQTSEGPQAALQLRFDPELRRETESRNQFAALCAEQVVQWLNDPDSGFVNAAEQSFQLLQPADIAILVRNIKEAQAVRRQLRQRGVASVYLSDKDSVFSSQEARDLWYWLQAVANPSDSRLLRAAWATRLMDLSMKDLQTLASQDDAFDARALVMRELHQVWLNQGVLAMLRQSLHRFDLPSHWLGQPDGERRLTNFLHMAELLQEASVTLEGEQALLSWLADHLHGEGAQSEEQVLRLESDADLVKVITIHKSKGLEFPIVCLPFACSYRKQDRGNTRYVKQEDLSGQGANVLLNYSTEDLAQINEQRLREDIRLLYVAMTRPRHVLWMGFSLLTKGTAKECHIEEGAAGYLVGGAHVSDLSDFSAGLKMLAGEGEVMDLVASSEPASFSPFVARSQLPDLVAPINYQAQFDKRWAIGSFSGLVKAIALQASAPGLPLLQTLRPADDEVLPEPTSEMPEQAPVAPPTAEPVATWHRLGRGALMGNFLHDQLEWLAGEGFALPPPAQAALDLEDTDIAGSLSARLFRRCERAGQGAIAPAVVHWLSTVVNAPIAPLGIGLCGLNQFLPEMEFWLPVANLKARTLDELCQTHIWPGLSRPDLPDSRLHGFLMGFADLVFEHEGRYWVLDYKSNTLGEGAQAYTAAALKEAVAHHRYDVQAALYVYALHRLLQCRLGDAYQPAHHLGGALVFFIRGVDGPTHGVVHLPPSKEVIEGLQAMLEGEAHP